VRFPGESVAYRKARTELLAEEIDLRRRIERVAELRRALPPGGEVPEDYVFQGVDGPVKFSELFGRHPTLITYNWMFGPQRERPCPMCTSLLSAYDGEMPDILQRVAFAVIATLAHRAHESLCRRARLAPPAAVFVGGQQFQRRLRRGNARQRRCAPLSTCSAATAKPCDISGPPRWVRARRTREKTRAARPTRCRSGTCST
jgi:hypothetical protein